MKKSIYVVLLGMLFSMSVFAQSEQEVVLEEIVITGVQPGPGLWRVSKDDHVLWIMGVLSPLPKKMKWRSEAIELIMIDSQEVIMPPSGQTNIGLFKGMLLLPSMIGIQKNPNNEKLSNTLPGEVYIRWLKLKEKYMKGNNESIEKLRPLYAAQKLFGHAVESVGFGGDAGVWDTVNDIAKKNKLKKTYPSINIEMKDPRGTIKKFKETPLEDVTCFTQTIERLETDLENMRLRANAWAIGDVNVLQDLALIDQNTSCNTAFFSSAVAQDTGDMEAQLQNAWTASVENALQRNRSTFAVLPLVDLLKVNGYLESLRAKGYSIEAPN